MTNVMIVEDNERILNNYQRYFSTKDDISLVGYAKDGENAIKLYEEKKPNVILLDLGLPKISGIEVIDKISNLEHDRNKGNIIVVSGSNELRYKLLNTKKVYRVIPKPCQMSTIVNTIKEYENEYAEQFPSQKLNEILLKLNLRTHSKSCTYLIEVIKFSYEQPYMLENLNKIYAIIAKRNNCYAETIKSSLRSSIRIVNKTTNYDLLSSIFFIDKKDYNKILTPKYFINCIIDYLKTDGNFYI